MFLLFILSLIFIPNLAFGFEQPKVILAEILIEILFFLTLYKKGWKFFKRNPRQLAFLLSSLFLLSIVSLLLNFSEVNFFGNIFRLQGPWLFWHLLIFCLLVPKIGINFKKYRRLYLISLGLLFLSTVFLGENLATRAIGSLGEPNALAATSLFILSFILVTQNNSLKIGGFILSAIILHLTNSNSAILALIIQSVFYFLAIMEKYSISKSFLICLALVCTTLITPAIDQGESIENRLKIWDLAFQTGLKSPLIGHGFGNMQSLDLQAEKIPGELKNLSIDSSHNLLLDFWVQGGFIGLGLFLILLFLSLKNLIAQSRVLELMAFLGLFTMSLFNPLSVVNLIGLWWIIGRGFQVSTSEVTG